MKTFKTNKILVALTFMCLLTFSVSLFAQTKGNLLYEGNYTAGSVVYPNGTTFPPTTSSMYIHIFSEEIEIFGYGKFKFQGTTDEGRKYTCSGGFYGNQSLYVDANYNIIHYYQVNGTPVSQKYTTKGSTSSQNQGGHYVGGNSGGNNSSGSSNRNSTSMQPKQHKCSLCNGTGRVINTDGVSFGNTKWCSECGKTVPDYHYHTTCPSCKGKGYW